MWLILLTQGERSMKKVDLTDIIVMLSTLSDDDKKEGVSRPRRTKLNVKRLFRDLSTHAPVTERYRVTRPKKGGHQKMASYYTYTRA